MDTNEFYQNERIKKFLRFYGFIPPVEDDELENYTKHEKRFDTPPLPSEIDDAMMILKTGYITAEPNNSIIKNDAYENMARAAREGKVIPSDIIKKMHQDRENAEIDGSDT